MYKAALERFPSCEIAILAAAVSDFTPTQVAQEKIKRKGDKLIIELEPTHDIAKSLGQIKTNQQTLVGFALETENELDNAKRKLASKNLDFIVLNSTNDTGAGFDVDTNKITIIDRTGKITPFPLKSKQEVARDIVDTLINGILKA